MPTVTLTVPVAIGICLACFTAGVIYMALLNWVCFLAHRDNAKEEKVRNES